MGLDNIVNVQISRETAGVSQAGFGTPLILGPNAGFLGVRTYNSITAMAEDFATSTAEYSMAQKVFSQTPRVRQIKVAKSDLVAQSSELTPTVENEEQYEVTFNPEAETPELYSYTSSEAATAEEIVSGLITEIMGEEVQQLTFSSIPDAGSFRLHSGLEAVEITQGDGASDVQAKLRTLDGLASVVVSGDFDIGFTVIFRGFEGDAPLLAISDNTLEESLNAISINVLVLREGAERTHGVIATGTDTLILTASQLGGSLDFSNSANLEAEEITEAASIADAIFAARDSDDDWYFLLTVPTSDVVVKEAAATIEAMRKMYGFRNGDSDVRSSADDDLLSELNGLGYFRTFVFYTGDPAEFGDAGFIGRLAPLDPGSETWANKTIAGVPVDSWTDSELNNLQTKNANYYIRIAGVSVTQNGKVVGGEYIDVIRFVDWLAARMQEEVFGDMIRLPKIPYTNVGIAIVEAGMRAVLERGVTAGGIPSSEDYSIVTPKVSDISAGDRAARRLPGVRFSATLAGAIHAVEIQGVVTI